MEASTRKLLAVALAVVMMISVVGMVGAQEPQQQVDSPMDSNATVAFSDQMTDGTSVTVDSVNMSDGGFVVIHDDSLLDGEVTGSVIGVSEYLEPGENEDVTVTLFDGVPGATFDQTELTEDEMLIAMPHFDTNANETYDFVATDGSEDGPYVANETAVTDSANVTVETTQANGESFAVVDLTAPEAVEQGETLNVSANIENPNDEADTQTVEYRFNGSVSAREQVSLDAGESTNFTASVNTSELAAGTYIHGVYTRDEGQPAQVRIVEEIDSFEVTGLTAPESVNVGNEVTVSATVSNPNDFATEQPVQFRFDGDLMETRYVELDGESSMDVQFEIRATGPAGTYIHSVFTNDFGQDAIITVETPGEGPPTDGDEGDDGADDEDGVDDEDGADDSDEADDEDGADGEDGVDDEDGADGDDTEDEDVTDGDDAEEDDSAGDDSDEEQPEIPEDG